MGAQSLAFAALASFALAFLLALLLRPAFSRLGLVDVPNHRSSHEKPTLIGGGVSVVIAVAIVHFVIVAWDGAADLPETAVVVAGLALAATGFADDLAGLEVVPRLAVQIVVSVALGAVLLTHAGLSLWLLIPFVIVGVVSVNGANFMDGVNGMSAFHGAILGAVAAFAGLWSSDASLALLGVTLGAAFLGFLPWNFPKATVFLGDVGSYFLGAMFLGVGALVWLATGSLFLAVSPVSMYALDVFGTLLRRAAKGENLTKAHRDHYYQIVRRRTNSHIVATLYVSFGTLAVVGLAACSVAELIPNRLAVFLAVAVGVFFVLVGWAPWRRSIVSDQEEPKCV